MGLQAQNAPSPYFALWSRLRRFEPSGLSRLILERRAVRSSLHRATIHLVSARDFHVLSPLLQPVLDRALNGTFGRRLAGVDREMVAAAGIELLRAPPARGLTGSELGALLQERWPRHDGRVLAYAVQYIAPLVQVPPRGVWGAGGPAAWLPASDWLGRGRSNGSLERLALRYLAAFGPASVRDMSAWSGLRGLREVFERLRARLRTFTSDTGTELFDLPRAPRPPADTAAPPRFLPDYDNVLLGHADRRRIVADDHRKVQSIGSATVLIDGFVRGKWKIVRTPKSATLLVSPFESITRKDRTAVAAEGRELLAFAAPHARSYAVEFRRV